MKISNVIHLYVILLQMLSLKLFYNSNFHLLRQTLSFIIPNYGDLAVFAECK